LRAPWARHISPPAPIATFPGLIFIPFCYAEAVANLLTNPALDPFGKIPEYKFCAARIGKARANGPLAAPV
jgi:formate dehydrogenase major subunit